MAIICFGEVMLRLTPYMYQKLEQAKSLSLDFGGSESNVAVTLAQLNQAVRYVTRVPDNSFGETALNSLDQFGINTSYSIKGGERLGIYFVELGSGRRSSKVIYDRKNSGMHSLAPGMIDWSIVLPGCTWFHWSGITPALSKNAAAATKGAILAAKQAGVKISCDLNYRSKLWDYGIPPHKIMPELIELCDVIVGDMDVMDTYFQLPCSDMHDGFQKLSIRFPNLEFIGVSERSGLSATHNTYQGYLYHKGVIEVSTKYDLPDMVDRIGSGDAFTAGLIHQLQYTNNLKEIVEFATATSVYKHYIPGDMNYFSIEDIHGLMHGQSGGKVKR
jgi:2-dehydro-3-deoxygluconokinase